jgi:hypothetical protein
MSSTTTATAAEKKDEDDVVVDMEQLEMDIEKSAPRVIKHMNNDHPESVKAYALAFGDHPRCSQTQSALLTGLDVDGFVLQITLRNGTTIQNVHVPYDRRIQDAKELHQIAVDMHVKAYEKLGVWYKITSGYYKKAIQMMSFQAYKKAKQRPVESIVIATTVTVGLGIVSLYGYRTYSNNRLTIQQRR